MSENKRNRKSNQNREPKRPIILAKKSDKDEKSLPDKPRILLKPKDTPEQSRSTPTTATTTQISIASRPIDHGSNNVDASKACRTQSTPTTTTTKDSKDTPTVSTDTVSTENRLKSMKKPFSIISDHYQIQNHAQEFLIETNSDFTVVGVIGTQGSGKSFILNMLIDDETDFDDTAHVDKLIKGQTGVFRMRNQLKERLSNMNCTEGIQMYITRHRTILLDCSPILCNPYKKEAILNELDDLKMLIFLLNVCNTLIVVEDCGFNLHMMRLLLTAESMKVDAYENDLNERRHSPNILIFKNKCQNRDFLGEAKHRTKQLYRAFFQCSGLKMPQPHRNQLNKLTGGGDEGDVDIFYFPWIDGSDKNHYQPHPDIDLLVAEFRQRIFMAPQTPFPVPNQQTTACTEINWFHQALAVYDLQKTSYFLRKYESIKEKEWSLRV